MLKSIGLDSSIALDSCIGQESEGTDFKKKSKKRIIWFKIIVSDKRLVFDMVTKKHYE